MLRRSCSLLSLLAFASSAHAAELGDARVSSHIGQQLVADIDLAMVEDPATPVAVRLASREVYNGAGIAMPPALSSLNMSVMRRDGRQVLHVTSLRPVDAEHLHLYLELTDKGQRAVRLVTLWLTPDPNPAPPPPPAPVPAPPPAPLAAPAAAPAVVPAPLQLPARPVAAAQAHAAHTAPAPVPPAVAAPAARAPARPRPEPAPAVQAAAERKKQLVLPIHKPARPAALHAAGQPSACVSQPDEAQACTALGAKNTALREQLGKLEEKVKGLQQALGVAPAAVAASPTEHKPQAPAAEANKPEPIKTAQVKPEARKSAEHEAGEHKPQAPGADEHKPGAAESEAKAPDAAPPPEAKPPEIKPVKPAGPKPISSIKPLVPHKPKAPPPEEGGAPWGWIAGAVALLAGAAGAAFLLQRRARARKAGTPAGPGLLDKLKARFKAHFAARFAARAKGAAAPAGAPEKVVEPTME